MSGYFHSRALEGNARSFREPQGTGEAQLLALLEEALAGRVIEEGERVSPKGHRRAGEYRFSHALVQETLLAELSTTRKVRSHGRVAEALETLYGSGAEKHAAELTALGRSQDRGSDPRLGLQTALRAVALYRERGDGLGLARATLAALAAGGAGGGLLPRERVVALADEAVAALEDRDPHLEALLLMFRAGPDWDQAAEAAAARAAALATAHGYLDIEARLLGRESTRARNELRFDDAVAAGRAAQRAFERSGTADFGNLSLSVVASLYHVGRLDEADAAASELVAYFRKVHIRPPEWAWLAVQARVALLRCDFGRFEFLAAEAPGDHVPMSVLRAIRRELVGDLEGALGSLHRPGGLESAATENRPAPQTLTQTRHSGRRRTADERSNDRRGARHPCPAPLPRR